MNKREFDMAYDAEMNRIDPLEEYTFRCDDLDSFTCKDVVLMGDCMGMSIIDMIEENLLVQEDGEWYLNDNALSISDWNNKSEVY